MHNFFRIQSIGVIPLHQFKDVILEEQYKKCMGKIKKTWYSLTQEALVDYVYKVQISIQTFHALKTLQFYLELRFDVCGTEYRSENYCWLSTLRIGFNMLKC
jgi:hypothetical protein